MTDIQKFFEGNNLFITGGTGFIGKILVEKLLRGLPKLGKIYLLLRPKKGKNIQERFDEYFNIELFDPLREKDPSAIEKVIPLSGDMTKPNLGLSDADRTKLINEVSIVIHLAATTRMNEHLNLALSLNVYSVLEIIKLCRELKTLKVAVYISTAFIHSNLDHVEEKVYPISMTYEDANTAIEIMKRRNFSKEDEEKFTKLLLGDFPNTYFFSKAMAEEIIKKEASDLPFCIFRFPFALATYKEPFEGWVDVVQGINQIFIMGAMGILRLVLITDTKGFLYVVPADFVCNAIIACTWATANRINKKSDDTLAVYNFVSGEENSLKKRLFKEIASVYGPRYLPSTAVYLPSPIVVESKRMFEILKIFHYLLPALIGDVILRISGKKPKYYNIYKKGMKLTKLADFFMEKTWSFDTKNIEDLWERLSDDDKVLFQFDMTILDWSDVMMENWKGILKYIIKDDMSPESQKKNIRRYYKFLAIHRTLQFLFISFFIWLLWKIFSGSFFLS